MKIEKNNKYFTIAAYAVLSTLVVIGITIMLVNIRVIWGGLVSIIKSIVSLLAPLWLGVIFAYLMDPIVEFYSKKCNWHFKGFGKKKKHTKEQDRHTSRTMGTILTAVTIVAVIGLFILMISLNVSSVLASNKVEGLMLSINQYIVYFQSMIENVVETIGNLNISSQNMNILSKLYLFVDQFTTGLTDKIINTLPSIGENALNIGLAIVVGFYLVQDKEAMLVGWNKVLDFILPTRIRKESRKIGKDIDYVFSGYIRGQLIDAAIMASLISLALTLIGIDFAIIIGIIAGIFNIVPYFGPIVGFVLAGLIGAIGPAPQKAIYAMIAVVILQQIDGWYIVPKVIGNSVKLHPVVVLLSIVIGGKLFGLAGILLGVPIAAFIRLILIRYVDLEHSHL